MISDGRLWATDTLYESAVVSIFGGEFEVLGSKLHYDATTAITVQAGLGIRF